MEVRVLGPLEVIDDGRPVVIEGRKEQHLLAVLALRSPEVVSVETLTDFLWGDDPPPSAHKALQTYVSHLRRALEPGRAAGSPAALLPTRGSGYALQVGRQAVDAHRFEEAVAVGRRAWEEGDSERAWRALRDALRLWRGDAPAELGDSSAATAERNRLVESRLAAVEDRIEADLALGRHRGLIGELEALVGLHPFRERLWGQLMVGLYRSDRQADALRVYQRARGVLVGQLGVEPSPALRRLEAAVIAQDPSLELGAAPGKVSGARGSPAPFPAGAPVALPTPLALASAGVFVGRHHELSGLRDAWAGARAGVGRLVLVAGEPGIGKTTLAAHLAAHAAGAGARVLYGRCDEEVLVPFQPFVDALGGFLSVAPAALVDDLARTHGHELGRLLPPLAHVLQDHPSAGPGEPETRRHRLFEAVVATLRRLSADLPAVLIVDDLHWADQPTLLLLRHVTRALAELPLLVVATFRDADVDWSEPGARLLADLRRAGPVERIALSGLEEIEVGELLVASAGEEVGGPAARAVAGETGGNPFFVVEFARYWAETTPVRRSAGPAGRGAGVEPRLPAGVREVVAGRLSRLRPGARAVLAAAAVVGRDFDAHLVGRAADLDEEDVLDVLDEVAGAGLIVEERPGAAAGYCFSHAVVRRTIYEGLSAGRRARLHRRVATALEEVHRGSLEAHLGELAHHALGAAQGGAGPLRADEARRALDYARRAGDAALAALGFEEAARRYRQALEALAWIEPPDGTTRAGLLVALGRALAAAGELDSGRVAFGEAATLARQLGDVELLVAATLGYAGPEPLHLAADQHAAELLGEALDAVGEEDSPARVRLLSGLVRYQALAAPTAQVRGTSRMALDAARRLGDPETLAVALAGHLSGLGGPDVSDQRLGAADELGALAGRLGSTELALRALFHRIWALLERNDLLLAHEAIAVFAERSAEHGLPGTRWAAAQHRLFWLLAEGDFDEAERLSGDAARDGGAAQTFQLAALCRILQHGLIRWFRGELLEIEALSPANAPALAFLDLMPVLGVMTHIRGGREDQAGAELAVLTDERALAAIPRTMMWPATVAFLGGACAQLGDTRGADAVYRLLAPHANSNCVVASWLFLGAYSHYLGLLAAACSRFDDAEAHLDDAIRRHRAMGARPWLAFSQWALAATLGARGRPGDRVRAAELAGEADRTAAQIGLRVPVKPGAKPAKAAAPPAGDRR